MLDNPEPHASWNETAIEANDYFQNCISSFKKGNPVALPHYFHVTGKRDAETNKTSYVSIIKNQQIETNKSFRGSGAFAATYDTCTKNDKNLTTFAIDEEEIYRISGCYFFGRERLAEDEIFDSLWVRTYGIAVTPQTVAYMVAEDPQACENIQKKLIEENLKLDVPVLPRKTNRYITNLLDRAGKQHHIPENWRWYTGEDLENHRVPSNVLQPQHKLRTHY